MTDNFPGPYELRFYSTRATFVHVNRLNVDIFDAPSPGDPFSDMEFKERGGGLVDGAVAIDAWITLIKPQFNADTTFNYVELWAYEPGSFEAAYVSTYDIAVAGTGAASSQTAGQAIFTFRSAEGGVLKLNFLESVIVAGPALSYTGLTAGQKSIVDFVIGADGWLLARDTSYPFAFARMYPGQNEKLFKKRYRNS